MPLWKPPLWIRYEDLVADKLAVARALAAYLGEPCPDTVLSTTIEQLEHERNRDYIKFNRGVTGRWAAEATERQKAHLREIAALHPGSDLGLT